MFRNVCDTLYRMRVQKSQLLHSPLGRDVLKFNGCSEFWWIGFGMLIQSISFATQNWCRTCEYSDTANPSIVDRLPRITHGHKRISCRIGFDD